MISSQLMSCYGASKTHKSMGVHQGNVEANAPMDMLKTKELERSIDAKQVIHSDLRDANVEEVELLELMEKKGGRSINIERIAGAEAGATQRWREAEHVRRQRATSSSLKAELLELI